MKKQAVPTLTWSQRLREGLAALNPRLLGRDLAGALAGGSSRDGLPVRLSNRTYAGTRNVAVRELGFDQPLLWVVVALLAWGLVMVYSASIALPDNPRFANYAHTHFVMRHAISHGHRLGGGDGGVPVPHAQLGKAWRPGCSRWRWCCWCWC